MHTAYNQLRNAQKTKKALSKQQRHEVYQVEFKRYPSKRLKDIHIQQDLIRLVFEILPYMLSDASLFSYLL